MSGRDINWVIGPWWGVVAGAAMITFHRAIARFFMENQSGIRFEVFFMRAKSERRDFVPLQVLCVVVGLAILVPSALILVGILVPRSH
jgi:hypothetical protein